MSTRSLLSLCLITVFTVAIAAWVVGSRPTIEASDFDGTLAFPGLVDTLNDVKKIRISHKDGEFNLELSENGWVFRERDNYPVQDDKIGELLVKLTRMEKVEPKTKLSERYDRLDLLHVEEKGDTRAKVIELFNVGGESIASLLVGKRKFTLGSSEGGTYVLFPTDSQAWLVTGELNPGARARDWLVREISDIKDNDIRSVSIQHPDGEMLTISKENPEDSNYTVEGIPDGMELRRDTIANDGGRVLSNLLLDDVKNASLVEFPTEQMITATFRGFNDFSIIVELIEDDDVNWLRFRGEIHSQEDESKDWSSIISELNNKASGWVYQLPGYEVAGIKKRMADMVREPEEDGV